MAAQTDTRDTTNSIAENDAEYTLREDAADEATIPQDGHSTAGEDQPAAPGYAPLRHPCRRSRTQRSRAIWLNFRQNCATRPQILPKSQHKLDGLASQ